MLSLWKGSLPPLDAWRGCVMATEIQAGIILDVLTERERQKHLFPGASVSDDIGDLTRLMVLTEESGEVAKAVRLTLYPRATPPNLREELVQVAAVCVGWLEWLDAAAQAKSGGGE